LRGETQVFAHGKVEEQVRDLERTRKPGMLQTMRRRPGHIFTFDQHLPGMRA